tara:strand:+ start:2502 stop:3389 length:888 start_codon:yes stop_codon:yes gene_type:complete
MKALPEQLQMIEHVVVGDAYYFPNLSNAYYHKSPGLSSSNIRRFSQSQLHSLEEVIETTPAMNFGSAAHSLVVEGESAFFSDVVCLSGSLLTNANKLLKKESMDRGLTVINEKDKDTIYSMRNSLVTESKAYLNPENEYPQVFNSPYEVSIYWYEQDLLCKTRADVVLNPFEKPHASNGIVLVDYKTTVDCSVKGFTNSVRRYSYDLQAAWYKRGFEKAGFKVHDFAFVAQEKKKPYASKVFKMNHTDMEAGWNYLSDYLTEYHKVLNGKPASIYNTPNVVDLDTGNFYREELNE